MFYRGAKNLEGKVGVELEKLKAYVLEAEKEEKVSVADFCKL